MSQAVEEMAAEYLRREMDEALEALRRDRERRGAAPAWPVLIRRG